jgi:hypothetical protein
MKSWLALSLACASVACAPSVQVTVAPGTDFSAYGTYAVVPSPESTAFVQRVIEEKVSAELDRRGYRAAPVGRNDLLVLARGRAVPTSRQVFAETPGGCCEIEEYIAGTLVIEIFETARGVRIFRGAVETEIDSRSEQEVGDAIRRSVRAILAEMPSGAPAPLAE